MRFVRDTQTRNKALRPQGTVVGTPEIGTMGGPKQPPTGTQVGGTEQVAGTQSTLTQVRGWPSNPGWLISSPAGSRSEQSKTDYALNEGPAPARVLRGLFARVFGKTGEEVASFPMTQDMSVLPHQQVIRLPNKTGPYARVYDDSAPIPAVYAGNPR